MYPYAFGPAPKPPPVGTQWRHTGQTLPWEVVASDKTEVKLCGPGSCRGYLTVSLDDFCKSYVRA